MTFEEVQSFLKEAKRYGCRPGLDSIRSLMHALGNPQEKLKIIHIAGTNGKGSTGAMIAAALTQAGYRTGIYSSPAVFSFEEMYTIDGKPIGQADCARIFTAVADGCPRMRAAGERYSPGAECGTEKIPDLNAEEAGDHPTRFEIETAAAFVWFKQQGCDAAVIEAGMGGTLDATNLITAPVLSVITPVSMDHMQFLGDTIGEIAVHKAGIIKPGCPVVTAAQEPGVLRVLEETARAKGSTLYPAEAPEDLPASLILPSMVPYQRENAACALTALRVLKPVFPRVGRRCTEQAFAGLRMRGRMERIACAPDFYIDGAHNAGAAAALRRTLDQCFTDREIIYIMGVLADKDTDGILETVFGGLSKKPAVLTVTPPSERALGADELAGRLRARGIEAAATASPGEAVQKARDRAKEAGPDAMILAFGSFTILKGIRDAVQSR